MDQRRRQNDHNDDDLPRRRKRMKKRNTTRSTGYNHTNIVILLAFLPVLPQLLLSFHHRSAIRWIHSYSITTTTMSTTGTPNRNNLYLDVTRTKRTSSTTITTTTFIPMTTTRNIALDIIRPSWHPNEHPQSSRFGSVLYSSHHPNHDGTIDDVSTTTTTTPRDTGNIHHDTPTYILDNVVTQKHHPLQLSPYTFAGMVECRLMEQFATTVRNDTTTVTDDDDDTDDPPHPIERILQSWRLLEQDYIHQEYIGHDTRTDDTDHPNSSNHHHYHDKNHTSTNMAYQLCHSYVPGLTIRPFWNVSQFDWCQRLSSHYESIRKEFKSVLSNPEYLQQHGNNVWATALDPNVAQQYGSGWSTLVLMNRGIWDVQNVHVFPITSQLLYDCDIPAVEIFFASMQPNSTIPYHSDYTNFVLTSHLGIDIPHNGQNKCRLNIGGIMEEEWCNGKVLMFDTSIMHNAINESPNQVRYILMMRIWHPDLTRIEQQALQYIYDTLEFPELMTATNNEDRIRIQEQIQHAKTFPLLLSSSSSSSSSKTTTRTTKGGGFGTTTATTNVVGATSATKKKPKKKGGK